MYLRFVGLNVDRASKYKQGLFTLAYDLKYKGEFDRYELDATSRILGWFENNLKIPAILKERDSNRCIAWFKPEAKEPIRQMWELYYLLQHKGLSVEVLKSIEIGRIKYKDEWQVIAQPNKQNYRACKYFGVRH